MNELSTAVKEILTESEDDSDFEDDIFTPASNERRKKHIEISSCSNSQDKNLIKRQKHEWRTISLDADQNLRREMKSKFSYQYLEHQSAEEEKKVFRYSKTVLLNSYKKCILYVITII